MKSDSLSKYVSLRRSVMAEKQKLETRLAALNQALAGQPEAKAAKLVTRKISAAGRKRIAAAQRARWAKFKAQKK